MKKNLLLLVIVLASCFSAQAKQVDVSKAMGIAQKVLHISSSSTTRSAEGNGGLNLVYTATAGSGSSTTRAAGVDGNLFYVFSQSDDKGFAIIAADNAVSPILAYSHENGFNGDNIPCNVQAVLDNYRAAISEAIANGKDASAEWSIAGTRAAEETIDGEYLLKSKWNQGWPYNAQTPTIAENHCVTGCVATAMAQVMYYWKYPEVGHGSKEYYWAGGGKTLTSNFTKPFDWESMKDEYSYYDPLTEMEIDAISHLMLQCGVSLEMSYYDQSAAVSDDLATALCAYFDYNPNTVRFYNSNNSGMSEEKWLQLVKSEIEDGRPIPYSSYGHAYVCDGYVDDGYLHINFGWGGSRDGFYRYMNCDNSYINDSYHEMICGVMPGNVTPSVMPEMKVTTNKFSCYTSGETIDAGTTPTFYISFITDNCSKTKSFIEKMAVAQVDGNGNIVNLFGEDTNVSHYLASSYYDAYPKACNIRNTSEVDMEMKFMPAYYYNGQWIVATDATPIVKKVKPLGTERATELQLTNAPQTVYSGSMQELNLSFYESKDFVGSIAMTISDEKGNSVFSSTRDVTFKGNYWCYLNFYANFEQTGVYTISLEAKDESGNSVEIKKNTNISLSLNVLDEANEIHLTDFGLDKTKYNFEANWGAYITKPGTSVYLGGTYKNPTNVDCTKKILLRLYKDNNYETLKETMQEIIIPANGEQRFSFVVNPQTRERIDLCEYDEENDNISYPKTLSSDNNVYNYLWVTIVDAPVLQLTKAPSFDYNTENLTAGRNQEKWLYVFFDKSKYGINYISSGIQLKAQIYQDGKIVGEMEKAIEAFYDEYIIFPLVGFDLTTGEYTMKFTLDFYGTDIPAIDENGNEAAYTLTIIDPDLLPKESYTLSNDGENYLFSANSKFVKGEECELRYNLENVHAEDFNGTIKVEEAWDYTWLNSHIQSEEKAITIKANSAERAYGTIKVNVPSNYNASMVCCKLMAKSQYDTEYREITNTYANINVVEPSAINSITTDDGATIHDGKITLGNDKAIEKVAVYDVAGRSIGGYTVSGNEIDLQSLPQGIYMVEISSGDSSPIKLKVQR